MFIRLNSILLTIYALVFLVYGFKNDEKFDALKFWQKYKYIVVFFILASIATLNYATKNSIFYLEKYLCFLIVPLVFYFKKNRYKAYVKVVFNALMYGCIIGLVICYFFTFKEIIENKEPLSYFFRWRHIGHNFSVYIDSHPSYMAYFIVLSLFYLLLYNKKIKSKVKLIIIVFFTLGLIQLAARTAIFLYTLIWMLFLIKNLSTKRILVILIITSITLISYNLGSNYLKERIFTPDSITNDLRFQRLSIYYDIFKEHPIFGIGFNRLEKDRKEKYLKKEFFISANKNYNAHNQFFEYLGVNGIVGGLIYLLVFISLIKLSFTTKNYLFLFVFISFFICNITESMLVRIKGIEFYSIFTAIFLNSIKKNRFKNN